MVEYLFQANSDDATVRVERLFEEEPTWFELVEAFQNFLAGQGYVISYSLRDVLEEHHEAKTLKKFGE